MHFRIICPCTKCHPPKFYNRDLELRSKMCLWVAKGFIIFLPTCQVSGPNTGSHNVSSPHLTGTKQQYPDWASLIEPHTSRVVFVCLFVIDQFTILCGCVHRNCVLWCVVSVELKMCELQKILNMVGKMVSC